VLTAAQVNEPRELIAWAARGTPRSRVARAVVSSVADAGDLRANAIISLAVEELVLHVRTLSRPAVRRRARRDAGRVHAGGMLTKARRCGSASSIG
jgi:N-acetylglucosamine kinase-like BadF-type ATPase